MKKTDIPYSEPVRELMGKPPGSILRWGTTVIFSVVILFLFFAWLVRYPDLVPSPVEVTTENPPVTLISRISGKIMHLFVADKDSVEPGSILAVMETAASFSEILELRKYLDTSAAVVPRKQYNVPALDRLGELQGSYSIYTKCMSDLATYVRNDFYGIKINSARDELAALRKYVDQLKVNERLMNENLNLDINRFRRDSLLNSGKTIAQAEFDRSKQMLNNQMIELQKVRLQISEKNIEIFSKQQLINEYSANRNEQLGKFHSLAEEAFSNLRSGLRIWETTYLLISPVSGIVSFTRFWSTNQTVNENEPVLSVVQAEQGRYIGRMYLNMPRSGKVEPGQPVYLKFSGYPYLEYGMVQGVVRKKSLVPAGNTYVIEIDLPDGLKTLYGHELTFTQNMQGTAEILTNDRSLLEKMISPFRYVLSKNRR